MQGVLRIRRGRAAEGKYRREDRELGIGASVRLRPQEGRAYDLKGLDILSC